ENTLSGRTTCKWYISEEIPEIETYFDRVYDQHEKIQWVSSGDQQFKPHEQQKNLEEKTVMQLHDIDPWEFEITIENKQQLDLQINKSAKDEDHIDLSAQPAQQIQHLNPDDQFGGTAVIQQADTTSMSGCPPEKVSSSTQDGGNQKQGGGGKKLLISK
ncbi:unnamed protein product, partial [Urochloa humidicola]